MKIKKTAILLGLCLMGITLSAQAVSPPWIKTVNINNMMNVVSDITAKVPTGTFPIVFPAAVPMQKGVTYYANDTANANGYTIYIDSTAKCNGAKYCNVFKLTLAKMTGPLPIYKNRQNQVMTVEETVQDGITGTYTPGFAMADYWNPQIAWQKESLTYTFTWASPEGPNHTRRDMLLMVNNLQTFAPVENSGNS